MEQSEKFTTCFSFKEKQNGVVKEIDNFRGVDIC